MRSPSISYQAGDERARVGHQGRVHVFGQSLELRRKDESSTQLVQKGGDGVDEQLEEIGEHLLERVDAHQGVDGREGGDVVARSAADGAVEFGARVHLRHEERIPVELQPADAAAAAAQS